MRIFGKQVNDPRTRYSTINLTVSPDDSSITIPAATMHAATITDVSGGAEQDVVPYVLGTNTEPFVIPAGTELGVRIDGGSLSTVALATTDTSAGRIAVAINTEVGASVASVVDGKLLIKSNGVAGDSGTLELLDVTNTPTSIIGVPSGTTLGSAFNTRGIITKSLDTLGGFAFVRLPGKQKINSEARSVTIASPQSPAATIDLKYNTDIVGGSPIHGRLTFDGTNYILKFFSSLPSNAEIVSVGATSSLVDTGDSINITVTADDATTPAFTTNFGAAPNGRSDIINSINSAWATATGFSSTVFIRTRYSQPFDFDTEEILISVNGGIEQTVSLSPTDETATEVAAKFTSADPNILAASVGNSTSTQGFYLTLSTNSGVGVNSSISIRNNPDSGIDTLGKLGISEGTYYGAHIARPKGLNEISLFAPNRGNKSTIEITGGTNIGKLGFAASGPVSGQEQIDVPVLIPTLESYENTSGDYQIEVLIPEVLSFGELLTDETSSLLEANDVGTGGNIDLRRDSYTDESRTSLPSLGSSIRNAGKPVYAGPDGLIDLAFLDKSTSILLKYLKKFVRADFKSGRVNGLIANSFYTGGVFNSPTEAFGTMSLFIDAEGNAISFSDPVDFVSTSGIRSLSLRFGDGSSNPGTRDAYDFFENQGHVRVPAIIGQNVSDDSNQAARSIARIQTPLRDLEERQLVYQNTNTDRGIIRIYVTPSNTPLGEVGRMEITSNARWSGAAWFQDDNQAVSTLFDTGGVVDGIHLKSHPAATPGTSFLDSEWNDRVTFPAEPSLSSPNKLSHALELGAQLIASGSSASANVPRVQVQFHGARTRTLLWESQIDTGSAGAIRIYASTNTSLETFAGGIDTGNRGIEITFNADWNEGTQIWSQDVTTGSKVSSRLYVGDRGLAFQATDPFVSDTFTDSEWQSSPGAPNFWLKAGAIPEFGISYSGSIRLNNDDFSPVGGSYRTGSVVANVIPKVVMRVEVTNGVITEVNGFGHDNSPTVFSDRINFDLPVVAADLDRVVGIVTVHEGSQDTDGDIISARFVSSSATFYGVVLIGEDLQPIDPSDVNTDASFSVAIYYDA